MEIKQWTIALQNEEDRIDTFLSAQTAKSRSAVQHWIEQDLAKVNQKPVSKNYKLRAGDVIELSIPDPVSYDVKAESIPLQIVYEDDDLLVVNKPKGMVVHPAAGHYDGTLVNALLSYCGDRLSGINGVMRPGIVHRIDKDTSGLLIVAKSDRAHQGLAEQIKVHSFTRIYEAMVFGKLSPQSGTVDLPIGRHPTQRKKMSVTANHSKPAITHYEVLEEFSRSGNGVSYSHVRLKLETGRTHQIRVHMAHIGHPIAGDTVYGPASQPKECRLLNGQCLHAKCIGFVHPVTGDTLYFDSDLPDYFTDFIAHCRKQNKG